MYSICVGQGLKAHQAYERRGEVDAECDGPLALSGGTRICCAGGTGTGSVEPVCEQKVVSSLVVKKVCALLVTTSA